MSTFEKNDELEEPLLLDTAFDSADKYQVEQQPEDDEKNVMSVRVWVETKKIWHTVGPSIFNRASELAMVLFTQAFAGRLGEVELASVSVASTVIIGFSYGFLLGMASALETLCGQAFGARRYYMLGVYMQRSWIVLFAVCIFLLPLYIFATPFLKLLGQPDEVADQTGTVALWLIPFHFSLAFQCPLQRFLQSQLKTSVVAWVSLGTLAIHVFTSWLLLYHFRLGVVGATIALDISWWLTVIGMLAYTVCGGCPETWAGFSTEAFSGLWEFLKFSSASGLMLCLENWYYRILIIMTGNLKNATIALDALSICMSINDWEIMIPFAFFTAIGVRVANELGAGNGKAAKFATVVAVVQSTLLGIVFFALILLFHDKLAFIFSSSTEVHHAVDKLSYLLAISVLLNSVQPVLSGVAVGSGWQSWVAYVNLTCYYLVGVPIGAVMGLVFKLGVQGLWGGMIFGGIVVQTAILAVITITRDWDKEAEKATVYCQTWTGSSHSLF